MIDALVMVCQKNCIKLKNNQVMFNHNHVFVQSNYVYLKEIVFHKVSSDSMFYDAVNKTTHSH